MEMREKKIVQMETKVVLLNSLAKMRQEVVKIEKRRRDRIITKKLKNC